MDLGITPGDFLTYAGVTLGSLGVIFAIVIAVRFVVNLAGKIWGRR